ncbi:MAG: hypothetical protein D3903_16495 [Candidatus Electrothrix sp. GM3_4]|nr:hypothetical protein [Candidatus Electrothrix sp. GM3_4]
MKRQLSCSFLLIILLAAEQTQATDIIVDGSTCTLAEAITSANNDDASGNGCPDGFENDTIILETHVSLTASLAEITSTITVEGLGHTIDGNDDRTVGSVLRISSTGDLTLNEITITGGSGEGFDISKKVYLGGGGIYNTGALTLNRSTVSNNSAIYYGGGIYNGNGGILILNNTTISGNSAPDGGGIFNTQGSVILRNSTISANGFDSGAVLMGSPEPAGGGILTIDGTVILKNSIVSGNKAKNDNGNELCNYYSNSTITADSYNIFAHSGETDNEAFCNFSPSNKDINATSDSTVPTTLEVILSPLADNGGTTLTHALVKGSPSVDLDLSCITGLETDQRGVPRPVGNGCDAGAFEFGSNLADDKNNGFLSPVYLLLL